MKKLLASILAAAAITGAAFAQGVQLEQVSVQKGISVNGLKKFQISLKAETIEIKQHEDKENKTIDVEILSNYTASYPQFTNDGKSIKLEQKDNTNKLKDRVCHVYITLPQDFIVPDAKISTTTADITITNMEAQKMDISTDSGKVKLTNVSSQELSVSSDKGDMTAKNVKVDKGASISSSSGNITVNDLEADDISAETQKGTAKFSGVKAKKISFNADKGALELNLKTLFEKDSTVQVSSGSAKVYLPSNAVFWTSGSVAKGRFRSEFSQDSKGPLLTTKVGGGDLQIIKD